MSLTTDFQQTPYFDDYSEDKNFHRVLFKAGYAVQARELTQLQSILQNQIERFGENIIKEGSIVKGGNFVEVNPLNYVKILDDIEDSNGSQILNPDLTAFVGMYAYGVTTGLKALIIETANGSQTTVNETKTVFVKYLNNAQNSITGANIDTFSALEDIEIYSDSSLLNLEYTVTGGGQNSNINTAVNANGDPEPPVGNGYGVRCGSGVIFQKGHFVKFEDDLTVVSRYSTEPTDVVVGFRTFESIITADQDPTLFDNAAGFDNENAPGADRLQLTPNLVALTVAQANADENFFSLQEYQNGKVVRRRLTTQYDAIGKTMEQRTYEESGNYTLNEFKVKMEENTSDSSKVSVNISPGIAYVEGKRVELTGNYNVPLDKSLNTDLINVVDQDIASSYGNYVLTEDNPTTNMNFDSDNFEVVEFMNGSDVVGTARLRNITKDGSKYRLYVFDIKSASGFTFSQATSVRSEANPSEAVVGLDSSTLYDFNYRSVLYPVGKSFIKSIATGSNGSSFMYRGKESQTTSGNIVITLPSTHSFTYGVTGSPLLSDQVADFIVINDNLGEVLPITSVTQTSNQSVTINAGISSSTTVNVYFNAKIDSLSINTKTLEEYSCDIDVASYSSSNQTWSLGIPDVYEITSVEWNGNDVTSSFILDNGQKDTHYDYSRLVNTSSTSYTTGNLVVEFRAFTHGLNGTFFSVDSYPIDDVAPYDANKIRTEQIPSYSTENGNLLYLRDVIDCRPSPTRSYTTAVVGDISSEPTLQFSGPNINFPAVNETIELTYDYNIGRYDRLIIDEKGVFRVITGIADESPVVPSEPKKGMSLAVLKLPPFPCIPMSTAKVAGKTDYGITIVPQKNKRYTMKDIGRIETRIKSLEYFTSLSLLEKQTKDLIITDGQGTDRFKNGILVDNFQNLAIANTKSNEFSAAVDPAFKELMPRFRSYPISFKPGSTTNIFDSGVAATLAKEDVDVIVQEYATNTKSLTTDFYKYDGAMVIYPEHDSSPDVTIAPDINIEIDLATPFIEFTELLSEFVPLQNMTEEVVNTVTNRRGFLGFGRSVTDTVQTTTNELQVTEGNTEEQGLGDFVTDLQFEPFMRGRDIEVTATGLKPNTRMYFFFDGKSIDEHMSNGTSVTSQTSGDTYISQADEFGSNPIITDSNGVVNAIFRLPGETFFVGDRKLECMDTSIYADKENASSYASRTYSAFNFSVEKTGMTVSTRMPRMEIETTVSFSERTRRRGCDPLAQTFIIDEDQSNDTSVMLTSIDVFFERKSQTNNGVTLAITETLNGYPTGRVVPFSQVHKNVDDVSISANGQTATTFTFEAPVAVRTGIEYAIILAPDANDPDYRAWISTTGQTDVYSEIAVTQDTNAGVIFTSTNAKAWTPYQDENLKFVVRRANFTSLNGALELVTNDIEFLEIDNAGDFTPGEEVVQLKALAAQNVTGATTGATNVTMTYSPGYTLSVGDKIVLIGLLAGLGYETKVHTVESINGTQVTLESPIVKDLSSAPTVQAWVVASGKLLYQTHTVPQRIILEESTATWITSVGAARAFEQGAGNDQLIGLASSATADLTSVVNQKVSYMQPSIFRSNFTQTSTDVSILAPVAKDIAFNTNNYMSSNDIAIKSRSNEIVDNQNTSTREFKLEVVLDTNNNVNENIVATSPLIDYDISNAMVYEYLINNDGSEENTFRGNATSKYVSRTVELKDGLDAEDMRVFLTAYRPALSDVVVYAKFQSQFDGRKFEQIEWTPLTIKPETDLRSATSNRWDFVELEYALPTTAPSPDEGAGAWLDVSTNSIKYVAEDGSEYTDFKSFAIKIVLLAPNHYSVPRVKDLRALALS